MPNWCSNRLVLKRDIIDNIKNENGDVDFNILMPVPHGLIEVQGDFKETSKMFLYLYAYFSNNLERDKKEVIEIYKKQGSMAFVFADWDNAKDKILQNEEYLESPEEFCNKGKNIANMIEEFGEISVYEWHCKFWGTKWNASDTSIEYSDDLCILNFETPWGPPYGWLYRLCELEVKFQNDWIEESGERGVIYSIGDGEIKSENYRNEYYDEEYDEEYEEDKNKDKTDKEEKINIFNIEER